MMEEEEEEWNGGWEENWGILEEEGGVEPGRGKGRDEMGTRREERRKGEAMDGGYHIRRRWKFWVCKAQRSGKKPRKTCSRSAVQGGGGEDAKNAKLHGHMSCTI